MEIKCEYCGGFFEDTLESCPHCNGTNNNIRRVVDVTPKTIDELKKWYADRKLPPSETTRFFIGENYTKPKAFGIYRDNTQVIVYKNKADGTRAIRYQGTDEAYAVNEIYLKLKSEILNQKALNKNGGTKGSAGRGSKKSNGIVIGSVFGMIALGVISELFKGSLIAIIIAAFVSIIGGLFLFNKWKFKDFKPKPLLYILLFLIVFVIAYLPLHKYYTPKYYNYNDSVYCQYKGNYYEYNGYDYDPIDYAALPVPMTQNMPDYEYNWNDQSWDSNYDFEDSNYYAENFASSSSDSDSSYDWDSGDSWDSGGSDWSSDW